MKISSLFVLVVVLALFVCMNGVVSVATYYVPDDYAKIQWAVDSDDHVFEVTADYVNIKVYIEKKVL